MSKGITTFSLKVVGDTDKGFRVQMEVMGDRLPDSPLSGCPFSALMVAADAVKAVSDRLLEKQIMEEGEPCEHVVRQRKLLDIVHARRESPEAIVQKMLKKFN